jgi:plastocyanin
MVQRCKVVVVVVVGLVVLSSLAATAHAATFNVTVGDDFFSPRSVTIQQGDTVVWTWASGADDHNVRSTTPCCVLNSSTMNAPATYQYTFNQPPGTYSYRCSLHSGMTGSVVVQGTDTTPPPAPTASPRGGTYRSAQTVALSDAESGVAIHYTTNGTAPTATSTRYTGAITISASTTLKAIAIDAAGNQSPVTTETYTIDTVAPPAPTASPPAGAYTATQNVQLAAAESGVTIRYTTDGTTPNGMSTQYSLPITVDRSMTIRAIAIDAAGNQSPVASFAYTIDTTAPPAPTASPPPGRYATAQDVALSGESGAVIRYTTDGTTPTASSTRYTAPIRVAATTTIRAIAVDAAGNQSPVAQLAYTIDNGVPPAPTASPPGGTYRAAQTVTLSSVPGTTIRYTTDGSGPSGSSPQYTGPITVDRSLTIRAIAVDGEGDVSPAAAFAYVIDGTPPPAPQASPAPATYRSAQDVTLTNADPDATTYYTTDGSTPTTASPRYTSPIRVVTTTTIKAIAVDPAGNQSAVSTFVYAIDTTAPPAPTAAPEPGAYARAQQVTLAVAEAGAAIRYTTDGSDPRTSGSRYDGAIAVDRSTTIRAVAVDAAGNESPVESFAYEIDTDAPPAPAASPAPGAYRSAQTVTLTAGEPGATIRYTTDGSDPTPSSTAYAAPVDVAETTTIKAVAFDAVGNASSVAALRYVIDAVAPPPPTASPPGGRYDGAQDVRLADADPDATIRYTTDGSQPDAGSTAYTGPIRVDANTTITAVAVDPAGNAGDPAAFEYVIAPPPPPAARIVQVGGYRYAPAEIIVNKGETVTWTWTGPDFNHNVESEPGSGESFDSHPGVPYESIGAPPGGTYQRKFDAVGSFGYLCRIHPEMRGTVRVVESGAPDQQPADQGASPAAPPPPATTAAPSAGGRTWSVDVADMRFAPAALTVGQGDAVTWRWSGADKNHTVTSLAAQPEAFESHPGIRLADVTTGPVGGTFSHTFDALGTTTYFCRTHPEMKGRITVVPRSQAPSPSAVDPTPPRLGRIRLSLSGRRLIVRFRLSEQARLWGSLRVKPRKARRYQRVRKLNLRGRRGANRVALRLPLRAMRRGARLRVRLLGADASGNRASAATATRAVARRRGGTATLVRP